MNFLDAHSSQIDKIGKDMYTWKEIIDRKDSSKPYLDIFKCIIDAFNTYDNTSSSEEQWVVQNLSQHLLKIIKLFPPILLESDKRKIALNYYCLYQILNADIGDMGSQHDKFYTDVLITKMKYESKYNLSPILEQSKLTNLGKERLKHAKDLYERQILYYKKQPFFLKERIKMQEYYANENIDGYGSSILKNIRHYPMYEKILSVFPDDSPFSSFH